MALIVSIVLAAMLPASAFAYEFGDIDINAMVQKEQVGKKTITLISSENISRIKNSKSKQLSRKTDDEKLNEILTSLGVDLTKIQIAKTSDSENLRFLVYKNRLIY